MTTSDASNTTAPHTLRDLGADPIIATTKDMTREMHRGFAMIHDALADPTRPRQSCGEVAAWWLRYAEKCTDHLRADPAAGAKAREANNG